VPACARDFAVDCFQRRRLNGGKGLACEISDDAIRRKKMLATEQPKLRLLDEFIDRSRCRGQAFQSLAKSSHDRIVWRRDAGVMARPLLMLVERGNALVDRLERSDGRLGHAQSCAQGPQERPGHTCRSIQGTSRRSKEDQLERNTEPAVRAKSFSNGSDVGSADPKRLLDVEVRKGLWKLGGSHESQMNRTQSVPLWPCRS
jgi:hypothetical protein